MNRVLFLLSIFILQACSLVGYQGVEEARYTVVREQGDFELRNYAPLALAETSVDADWEEAQDVAFKRLFNYISGENVSDKKISMTAPVIMNEVASEKIAMTAPVFREKTDKGWSVSFVLPEEYSAANAPQPKDSSVTIVEQAPRSVAVRTFSGSMKLDQVNRETEKLLAWVSMNKLKATAEPRLAGYDPPWTLPWFRRNEIQVEVTSAN